MSPVVLIPEHEGSHDAAELLQGFLDLHRAGTLVGFVICIALKGQRYFCESAGTLDRNPLSALGAAAMLVAEMQQRIPRQSRDTQF